ncbi:MAG: hypothetical protein Q8R01_14725, partial [Ramlibacter sp.]|nr:hypothetical protein [Ramlibacter sp.]
GESWWRGAARKVVPKKWWHDKLPGHFAKYPETRDHLLCCCLLDLRENRNFQAHGAGRGLKALRRSLQRACEDIGVDDDVIGRVLGMARRLAGLPQVPGASAAAAAVAAMSGHPLQQRRAAAGGAPSQTQQKPQSQQPKRHQAQHQRKHLVEACEG